MSKHSNQQADMQDMKHLIRLYRKAQKGCESYTETRQVADYIRCYLKNPNNIEHQTELKGMLAARLALNNLVGQYRSALGLEKPLLFEQWNVLGFRKTLPNLDRLARILTDAGIFRVIPSGVLRYSYRRPAQYLAAEMAIAGYTEADVYDAIERLQQHKEHAIMNLSSDYSFKGQPQQPRERPDGMPVSS